MCVTAKDHQQEVGGIVVNWRTHVIIIQIILKHRTYQVKFFWLLIWITDATHKTKPSKEFFILFYLIVKLGTTSISSLINSMVPFMTTCLRLGLDNQCWTTYMKHNMF